MTRDLETQTTQNFAWEEYVGPTGNVSAMSFGYGGGTQAVMVIDIAWDDLDKAVPEILGEHVKQSTVLKRKPPMRHPRLPALYCTRINSVQGIGWVDKQEAIWGPYSQYERARLTLLFEALPYPVVTDEQLNQYWSGSEFYRYTTREIVPSSEILQRPSGTFEYAEGSGSSGQPAVGDSVPFGLPMFLSKMEVTYTWHMVPEDGLFDSSNLPTKILDCVGKVNSATFDGFAAGTLLLLPPRFEPVPAPFFVNLFPWKPQRLWNVKLPMRHFDPPNGSTTRGHNLMPYNGADSTNKWWKVVAGDGSTTLYPTTAFANIFTLN